MSYINLLEKLEILMKLITNSQVLMVTTIFISIALVLFLNKQIDIKKLFKIVLLINLGSFLIMLFTNYKEMLSIYNNIVDKIFMNMYFPSVEIYMFILVFMTIVLLCSIFNFKMKKSYKLTNIISFFIIIYLFLSLIYVVTTNNLNIFVASSIYTNQEALTLLELSTLVFALWIIVTSINAISSSIYSYILNKKESKEEVVTINEVENLVTNDFSNNIVESPLVNSVDYTSVPVQSIELPKQVQQQVQPNNYSLEEYKTFNSILKQVIILNGFKPKITLNDLLDDRLLSIFSQEEVALYKKILLNSLN